VKGAEAVVRTLADCGVTTCFANPGTSEMHFVAALDTVPEMRGVLCLFEGVATGAADGYGRMTGHPASVLLHLGPGLANGLANLHNARRAGTPLVAVVGDHATYHKRYDAPLESDIDALAGSVSGWVRRTARSAEAGADAAAAVAAARTPPGQIATLILPADVTWTDGGEPAAPVAARPPAPVSPAAQSEAADALRGAGSGGETREPVIILLGGAGLTRSALDAASRIAAATGARLLAETFPARMERGAGVPSVTRLAYLVEQAADQLAGTRHLILAGARAPVSFFAYPGKPSTPLPDGCQVHVLAEPGDDVPGALAALADLAAPGAALAPQQPARPSVPDGELTAESAAAVIGALLPEGAIVCDEANTSGLWLPGATAAAGGWRGDRLSEPPGARAGGGWQRHVHGVGAVDARARATRHHHRHLQQRVVRHPRHGAAANRRGGRRADGARSAGSHSAGSRLHGARGGDGGAGQPRRHVRRVRHPARARSRRAGTAPDRGRAAAAPLARCWRA
jgi:acetolactate synthase I/II/III large subunit